MLIDGKKVIICATQRCGSTLLCNDLFNNNVGIPEEYFLGPINSRDKIPSKEILREITKSATSLNGIFAIKLMSNYCDKVDQYLSYLGFGNGSGKYWSSIAWSFNEATWIYIRRKSILRQAVSRFMARKTGVNHFLAEKNSEFKPGNSKVGRDEQYNQHVEYEHQTIEQHIVDITSENASWELFFHENDIEPIEIVYESIVDDVSYVREITDSVGLAPTSINTSRSLLRLSNENNEKMVKQFVEKATMKSNVEREKIPTYLEDIDNIVEQVSLVSERWISTPYYQNVENAAKTQWKNIIHPFINEFSVDYSNVLELAIGHGRITEILLEMSEHVIGVDVLQENVDFCANRFRDVDKLTLFKNDGVTLKEIINNTVSFIICFDSMVHFDSDVVRIYLTEFLRVLKSGGYAFLHHSNYSDNPEGDFNRAPHARNFMSESLFRHYAFKAGFKVIKTQVIPWGTGDKRFDSLDCLSLIQKM